MNNRYFLRVSKVFSIIGLSFLVLGVIMAIVAIFVSDGEARLALIILGGTFILLGVVFTPIGIGFKYHTRKIAQKAERLKRDGVCYDAEIIRSYQTYTTGYIANPVNIECVYRDRLGNNCLVSAKSVWLDNPYAGLKGLVAKVWVNPNDPRDYHIEVVSENADVRIDNDYR